MGDAAMEEFGGAPPAPQADAEFQTDEDAAAQVARMNAEAAAEEEAEERPGLLGRLMGKRGGTPPPPPSHDAAMPDYGEAPPTDASYTADASFDAGYDEEAQAALSDPALVAEAFGEAPPSRKERKGLPIVAIGWGALAVIVALVVGMFAFAPSTMVSALPGAARIYALFGMPIGSQGLTFEGVRYGWTNDGSQTVLEVQGNVRNISSSTMSVPTVVIALRDEKGEEISEWTTEVSETELGAGEQTPFLRQIPSPPSNVRSLKVRFAKAN